MDIIIKDKKESLSDARRKAIAEIKAGWGVEKATEAERVADAAREAKMFRDAGVKHVKGLGRPIAFIPARDFFRIFMKYGNEGSVDKDLLKFMQRDDDLKPLFVNRV